MPIATMVRITANERHTYGVARLQEGQNEARVTGMHDHRELGGMLLVGPSSQHRGERRQQPARRPVSEPGLVELRGTPLRSGTGEL